jgi:hypothetical protein
MMLAALRLWRKLPSDNFLMRNIFSNWSSCHARNRVWLIIKLHEVLLICWNINAKNKESMGFVDISLKEDMSIHRQSTATGAKACTKISKFGNERPKKSIDSSAKAWGVPWTRNLVFQ